MLRLRFISSFAYLILALAIFAVVYLPAQNETTVIIGLYSVAFLAYAIIVCLIQKNQLHVRTALAVGIGLRILLIFLFPNLSDDIYRFIWDGKMIHDGINPLSYTPQEFLRIRTDLLVDEWTTLYDLLNSPTYYTVYPPISQLVYYLGTIGDVSWGTSVILMKAMLCLGELGTVYLMIRLLRMMGKSAIWAMLYFLNPLVIIEIMGQLHFEGLMIFFLSLSFLCLVKKKYRLAGGMLALSVGTKLLPLMFIPAMLNFIGKENILKFIAGFVSILLVLFIPFFWTLDLGHFFESVNLYFQKFEFNASIYYLLRGVGKLLTGYNQISIIGPLLSVVTLFSILYISWRKKIQSYERLSVVLFWSFGIYLLLTTTVHPWYLCMLIFLGSFSKQLWPLVWSGVVVWSYTTYATPNFEQNLVLIFCEYLILAAALWWFTISTGHKKNLNN